MSTRASRWMLVASVVLNVFLVGALAGGAMQWFAARGKHEAVAEPAQPRALRFAASGLSFERQRQFIEALRRARREGREYGREAREGRRDVLAIVAAPQLDRTALDAALARTRNADVALRTRVEQSVADFAATLTPDERARFAEGLRLNGQWRLTNSVKMRGSADGQTSAAAAPNASSDSE